MEPILSKGTVISVNPSTKRIHYLDTTEEIVVQQYTGNGIYLVKGISINSKNPIQQYVDEVDIVRPRIEPNDW